MKRKGYHRPTIEDLVEISGIETLHPGGFALTKRTAEITGMRRGLHVLDVSSGRGTQALYYAKEFGVIVTGLDISEEMVSTAGRAADSAGLAGRVTFYQGDSQQLPFPDDSFDIVVNECAVGIPDDSQRVLNEIVRVAKPGGSIAIHESTWRKELSNAEKEEIAERYGTTPLEFSEWLHMLQQAGARDIKTEFDRWSEPEMFWKIRRERDVPHYTKVLTMRERLATVRRVIRTYGFQGVAKAFENERSFYRAVTQRKLGYCLFKGNKAAHTPGAVN
jgi:ubiquinone/menaquinone biosynthesis C-methylase UbiE